MRIQKREGKNGVSFRAQVRIHGFPSLNKTFKRKTDAVLWAQQQEAAIRRGEYQDIVSTARKRTLQEVIDRYKNEILPSKARTTQIAYTTYLDYWGREFGQHALSYIEPDVISQKLKKLREAGDTRFQHDASSQRSKPKSPKTMKHYRDSLELLFKFAKQWGWAGANPLDKVARITNIRNSRARYLSDDERGALLESCKTSPNGFLYPMVIFALSTGARRGEITKLELRDIDWFRNAATLRDTKNGETRTVPILHHLRNVLAEHVEKVEAFYAEHPHLTTRWVFPRQDGLGPIDIRKAWQNARDKAGIEDFRFHDLRHSAASYLAMNGANPLEIAEVLGHKTLQMVKRYSHLSESHTRSIVEKMNAKIF